MQSEYITNISHPESEVTPLMEKMIDMIKIGDMHKAEKKKGKLKKKLQQEEKRQQEKIKQKQDQETRLIAETTLNSLDNMFIRLESIDCPKIRNIIFIENFMQVLQISLGFFQAYSNSLPEDIRERIGGMSSKLINQMNQLTKVMQHVDISEKTIKNRINRVENPEKTVNNSL